MNPAFSLEDDGFEIPGGAFTEAELETLDRVAIEIESKENAKGGGRNIFANAVELLPMFRKQSILGIVEKHLGAEISLSEGIYLNKRDEANWLVAWHQDLFINVREKRELPGYGPWSVKGGRIYVQPPETVLQNCLWLRVNLDDNDEANGCLRVIPRSHLHGKLDVEQLRNMAATGPKVGLACKRGDVILFKPLLLHGSAKSAAPSQRRVFQVLYSGYRFSNGLAWPY